MFVKSALDPVAALQQANGIGLTKTEISERVFSRNLESNRLTETSRLLRGLGHAHSKTEGTGGAPLERWFLARKATN